ncbi:MAG: DUF3450 domain-containing protein, partial [Pseudomonadota bacterium]|nr:DUF3450 domain-containing protein [Pseudomonadota bacterium]
MRYFFYGSVLVALAMVSGGTLAQNLGDIQTSVEANARDGVSSQARVDALDDQTNELTREYRAALKQLASLREYNAQLEKLIVAQKAEMTSIRRQIDEVTNVDRTIMPLMFRMIDALEQFVELDTPFLGSERQQRVAALRFLMDRSDATPAEKYRRILEAYEIENEYGRTIEVYEGEMNIDGIDRTVSFLRIGRVALIYQTLDGEDSGVWNPKAATFTDLDGDFDSELRRAMRIAK